MSQNDFDYQKGFKDCFRVLGLINADGLTPEHQQILAEIIHTYRHSYRSLITDQMITNTPASLKNNSKFKAGIDNWKLANDIK